MAWLWLWHHRFMEGGCRNFSVVGLRTLSLRRLVGCASGTAPVRIVLECKSKKSIVCIVIPVCLWDQSICVYPNSTCSVWSRSALWLNNAARRGGLQAPRERSRGCLSVTYQCALLCTTFLFIASSISIDQVMTKSTMPFCERNPIRTIWASIIQCRMIPM
jgi:hypothetical protein